MSEWDARPVAVALYGPTASGKTAFAVALAQAFGGEVVSVDSALVYKRLDIGSAKPTLGERAGIPHHMLDLREPWQPYSAAEFVTDARAVVAGIHARGRLPILAGGTSLYMHALLHGLAPMPSADARLRSAITTEAQILGWPAMHAQLKRVDALAAERIQPTDAQRIQRALEVFRATGTPISAWQAQQLAQPRWPVRVLRLALLPPRDLERARVAQRLHQMVAHGFLEEVEGLRALPELAQHATPLDLPALRAVGYRQAWEWLDGKGSRETFTQRAIHATSQLAKRQRTWLKSQPSWQVFDPAGGVADLQDAVARFLPRSH